MHNPKPFFENYRGWWCVDLRVNGKRKRFRLAKGRENQPEALRRYHRLMLEYDVPEPVVRDRLTVAIACDLFLDWAAKHTSKAAYDQYRHFQQHFCNRHGRLLIVQLKPYHVTQWLDAQDWSDHTKRSAVIAVKRPFNWCCDEGYIDRSPIRAVKRPPASPRSRLVSHDEFKKLLAATDEDFRPFLLALRLTGARPGEVAKVTATDVNLAHHVWIIHDHKTARKTGKPRLIPLAPVMDALTRRLMEQNPEGPLFRNSHGRPWTRNAIRLRMKRLREKENLPPDVVAYSLRHTYATEALANNVSIAEVAEILGHSDTTTLSRNYNHLCQKSDVLQKAAIQAIRGVECA